MRRLGQILARVFGAFDWPLLLVLMLMAFMGLLIMHSAVGDTDWRFADQARNFVLAFIALWVVALTPPKWLMKLTPLLYVFGVVLLLGVEFFGETSKGATRWLDLGIVRIQPSEMLKITVPMMLAWYFHRNEGKFRLIDFFVALVLLLIPFILIVKQPDLGTTCWMLPLKHWIFGPTPRA